MKKLIIIFAIAGLTSACQKYLFDEVPGSSPEEIFEQAWTFTDQEYAFFDFKNINWDSVKQVYEPKISNEMGEEALFDTLANMLYLLRDGHVNLQSEFNRSRNWSWYINAPDNFNRFLLERKYFKNNQRIAGPFTSYQFDSIAYVYYGSFSNGWEQGSIQSIFNEAKDQKALIIDIRNNFGGSLGNVYGLGSYLVDESTALAKRRNKNGPEHDAFSEYENLEFSPADTLRFTDKPVVLLVNRKSYSASNFFATCLSALPNVTIMGDTTGGGGGAPSYTELSNGWSLRVSATQLYTLNDFNTEDGLPPDIYVDYGNDPEVDGILEEALRFLNE